MSTTKPATERAAGQGRAKLRHAHPDDVTLQTALEAVGDPVRRHILRQLAEVPDWTLACGRFDLPVSKATSSHHFAVLREAGLLEQRDAGTRRLNRLRRPEYDARFPGLLALVLSPELAGDPPATPPEKPAGT
jgi:DNA-binding transcriptional ArsR family regulator